VKKDIIFFVTEWQFLVNLIPGTHAMLSQTFCCNYSNNNNKNQQKLGGVERIFLA
jgi:hypothetical protein